MAAGLSRSILGTTWAEQTLARQAATTHGGIIGQRGENQRQVGVPDRRRGHSGYRLAPRHAAVAHVACCWYLGLTVRSPVEAIRRRGLPTTTDWCRDQAFSPSENRLLAAVLEPLAPSSTR